MWWSLVAVNKTINVASWSLEECSEFCFWGTEIYFFQNLFYLSRFHELHVHRFYFVVPKLLCDTNLLPLYFVFYKQEHILRPYYRRRRDYRSVRVGVPTWIKISSLLLSFLELKERSVCVSMEWAINTCKHCLANRHNVGSFCLGGSPNVKEIMYITYCWTNMNFRKL